MKAIPISDSCLEVLSKKVKMIISKPKNPLAKIG